MGAAPMFRTRTSMVKARAGSDACERVSSRRTRATSSAPGALHRQAVHDCGGQPFVIEDHVLGKSQGQLEVDVGSRVAALRVPLPAGKIPQVDADGAPPDGAVDAGLAFEVRGPGEHRQSAPGLEAAALGTIASKLITKPGIPESPRVEAKFQGTFGHPVCRRVQQIALQKPLHEARLGARIRSCGVAVEELPHLLLAGFAHPWRAHADALIPGKHGGLATSGPGDVAAILESRGPARHFVPGNRAPRSRCRRSACVRPRPAVRAGRGSGSR